MERAQIVAYFEVAEAFRMVALLAAAILSRLLVCGVRRKYRALEGNRRLMAESEPSAFFSTAQPSAECR